MRRYLWAFAVLAVHAQPVIRSSVRLVEVNVVVRDSHGPVADLTRNDFTLREQGKVRTISTFSVESQSGTEKAADAGLENTFSNRRKRVESNITVVLFDGLNTRFEDQAYAKQELVKFLRGVDPKERIAIYTLDRSLRVLCDFTNSPEEREKALASFRGATGAVLPTETESIATAHQDLGAGDAAVNAFLEQSTAMITSAGNVNRARMTLAAFGAIAGHLANVSGRKTLVWVTGSLPISVAAAAGAFNHANVSVYPVDARGLVGMPRQLLAVAPTVFTKHPEMAPPAPNFTPEGLQTMQELADLTGGRAFYNKNDLSGALRIALEDGAVTYTLGFYPDSESMDGKFHDLKVEVARPGVSVRYRKGYVALKEQPVSEEQGRRNLAEAIESPIESASLPLAAKITRKQESLAISLSMDIHGLAWEEKGAVNVFFVQQDGTGSVIDSKAYDLRFKKEDYEIYLKTGIEFNKSIVLKDGTKMVRILAVDRFNGSVGSLIVPLAQVK
jgi:VWFA-related protein